MTVSELIDILEKMPQDAIVEGYDYSASEYIEITEVNYDPGEHTVSVA